MKRLAIIGIFLFSVSTLAQGAHSVALTWNASVDTGGTVNVYRAPGSCTGTFTQIKTGVAAAGPYSDTGLGVGNFCYYVTAVLNGAESFPSNKILVPILPASPTVLVVVVTN